MLDAISLYQEQLENIAATLALDADNAELLEVRVKLRARRTLAEACVYAGPPHPIQAPINPSV